MTELEAIKKGISPFLLSLNLFPIKSAERFDKYGLKFPIDYLHKIGRCVIFLSTESIAEYVDILTKEIVDANNLQLICVIYERELYKLNNTYEALNATDIGRIAYMQLYCKSKEIKKNCKKMLEDIYNKEALKAIREG